MLDGLFNVTIKIYESKMAFDGLGEEELSEKRREILRSRHRNLSSREQYISKGNDQTVTDRFYVMGSMAQHPYIVPFGILVDENGQKYLIQDVNQGQTLSAHHLEIDCITYSGA